MPPHCWAARHRLWGDAAVRGALQQLPEQNSQGPFAQSPYQAVLQAHVVVGLLGNPDGFLKGQFSLLAMTDRQTDRGRTITVPAVLKIQHPDPEEYWSELCIMHSDLWFNSLCFPPSTQQCILVFRTASLTASANQNAAVTPTGLSSPVQATVASYCLNRGNI